MFYNITEIEGVGPEFAQKFEKVGITTTEHLLDKLRDPKVRTTVATTTGISEPLLTKWYSMADLMRIKGVGRQYGELLVASGVDSAEKLLTFEPGVLLHKLEAVNKEKNLTNGLPKLTDVVQWMKDCRETETVPTR